MADLALHAHLAGRERRRSALAAAPPRQQPTYFLEGLANLTSAVSKFPA